MKKNKLTIKKSTIIFIIILIALETFMTFPMIIGFIFPSFAYFYWVHFTSKYYGIVFSLFQYLPLTQYYVPLAILIISSLAILITIVSIKKNINLSLKNKIVNHCIIYISLLIFLIGFSSCIIVTTNNNIKINYINNDNYDKEYTLDDLIELDEFLSNKVIELASTFKRNNGDVVIDDRLEDLAISDLKNISSTYPFLKGLYPTKFRNFTKSLQETESGTSGITYPSFYSVFIDYRLGNIVLLNTITHELCHVKGVGRENEATFCSIMAGLKSSNKESQYAAYLESYIRVNSSLYDIDPKMAQTEENVLNMCLNNNYSEICNIHIKDIYNYIKKSDQIKLISYKLRNYQNYPEYLNIIKYLNNNYDTTLTINKKKVTVEEVEKEIMSGSTKKLIISIKNNKRIFADINLFLEEKQKYFWGIYQINSKEKEPKEKTRKEKIKYYLKPISKENDIILLLKNEYAEEYDYYRATRLLLEYFDNSKY